MVQVPIADPLRPLSLNGLQCISPYQSKTTVALSTVGVGESRGQQINRIVSFTDVLKQKRPG
ncbi:unnamed protein product [Acanthoscelides obtectus]|uniref:Uncharacterized protein n=1 Tax=Acanthoscelides obtectus TaxID=200917 RepID=A0A9P0P207_ACAOB|nr:unnamed protein product [Acanthoscelides obtectus]CAK1651729.1 hypothetical protein AOBTE_LOCUS17417 [Acanthoscelides obtectus]